MSRIASNTTARRHAATAARIGLAVLTGVLFGAILASPTATYPPDITVEACQQIAAHGFVPYVDHASCIANGMRVPFTAQP